VLFRSLRLEAYRRLAAAGDDTALAAVTDELVDRYGALPEQALLLVAVARLRTLCRELGVTEVSATGTGSGTTLRVAPVVLPDSAQIRLKRLYPAATYRATAAVVQVPIPRADATLGAPRIRDSELLTWVGDVLTAITAS
jgi:transcription-repair coupling factor (superfamily II helicase)